MEGREGLSSLACLIRSPGLGSGLLEATGSDGIDLGVNRVNPCEVGLGQGLARERAFPDETRQFDHRQGVDLGHGGLREVSGKERMDGPVREPQWGASTAASHRLRWAREPATRGPPA